MSVNRAEHAARKEHDANELTTREDLGSGQILIRYRLPLTATPFSRHRADGQVGEASTAGYDIVSSIPRLRCCRFETTGREK